MFHLFCFVLIDSVDEYYRAKTEMLCDRMYLKCDEEAIRNTRSFLDKLTNERIIQGLKHYLSQPQGTPAPAVVYEVLSQCEVMKPNVMDIFQQLVRKHGRSMKRLCLHVKRPLPSSIILMIHKDQYVQSFGLEVFNTLDHPYTRTEFNQSYDLVKTIISMLSLFFII